MFIKSVFANYYWLSARKYKRCCYGLCSVWIDDQERNWVSLWQINQSWQISKRRVAKTNRRFFQTEFRSLPKFLLQTKTRIRRRLHGIWKRSYSPSFILSRNLNPVKSRQRIPQIHKARARDLTRTPTFPPPSTFVWSPSSHLNTRQYIRLSLLKLLAICY